MIQHGRIDVAGCRDKEHEGRRRRDGPSAKCGSTGMGKMWNCSMRNAEGKMRNGMCGVTSHHVTASIPHFTTRCASIAWS